MAKSAESSNSRQAKTLKLGADLSLAQLASWSHICPHCGRAFPSCHALGGHQNAHRLLKKEAAANRLCFGPAAAAAFMRNFHILSSSPPAVVIPNTDLELAPPEPTLVKPVPIRVYANGKAVESGLKLPAEMDFMPEMLISASAERGSPTVSEEGTLSDGDIMEVDSNWKLDLDLKL